MKPTLFVLAAGMGSRYGGLKQLDGLGPNGETIMDYSIFDAIRGGFGKLVFVIRKSFEQDFREKIVAKYENHIPVEVVFQDLNDLPAGFTCPEGRQKPWGTNHAVLMGKDVIKEPFAVINADDFYGRDSFAVLGKWLSEMDGKQNQYCMVGYRVGNTLSESGSVARGVCETNAEGYLTGVVERTAIERIDGEIQFKDENGEKVVLEENTPVSMNMWGLTPAFMDTLYDGFVEFLQNVKAGDIKAEYLLPVMIDALIQKGTAQVDVLETKDTWFGVTYQEDKEVVIKAFKELTEAGVYPNGLYK